jgi:hypothetical protein
MLSALLTIWYSGLQAQVASCPLACNDLVQVSLDENCVVQITPDMMLEGNGTAPGCLYTVQVLNTNGQPLQLTGINPETGAAYVLGDHSWIGPAQVGKTLTVRVWLGNNSCWGSIKIEDKLAPTIDCPAPITIGCWKDTTFTVPVARDNCNGVLSSSSVVTLSDVTTELPCSDANRAVRKIRYQAKDASGNVSAICERVIYYSRITIADIKFPKNYDGTQHNLPHLECSGDWLWNSYKRISSVPFPANWDINGNKYPDPAETGGPYVKSNTNIRGIVDGRVNASDEPIGTGATIRLDTFYNDFVGNNTLCRINTTFTDTKIDICGSSFKVLRYWTVLDWCTGAIANQYQIIKVIDSMGPVATIPPDAPAGTIGCVAATSSPGGPITIASVSSVITANPYTCKGEWLAIDPINIFDCSGANKVTYTVDFALDPFSGDYFFSKDGVTSTQESVDGKPRWRLRNLPYGCTWVRYTLKDDCGNKTEAFTEIRVIDKTPPTPVCDEFTVTTLSNNGFARVFAEALDDGSHDNCSPVGFEVARMTAGCGQNANAFGPYVDFCCADVGTSVTVILKVWDDANGSGVYGDVVSGVSDNFNTCMVVVKVDDKVAPFITCPADKTIGCGADTSLLASEKPVWSTTSLSTPYFTDNCEATLTWATTGKLDNCGQGILYRTFTATDKGGRSYSCTQTITVRNSAPYTGPTAWPTSPKEVTGCMNVDTDPSKTGIPTIGATSCSQVAYTYEDQVFPFVDGVCFKILRKWTVIDWCKFAPNLKPNGEVYPTVPTSGINMWSYIQIIKVSETDKPKIAVTSKADTDAFGENCNGYVELKNSATDCTRSDLLRWTYTIDPNNDGVGPFITGTTNDASGTFAVGTYKITWTVEDMCGNQSTTSYVFKVVDKKKPTPYCISSLTTVVMPSSGMVEIWARDFDKGSFDNCSGPVLFSSVNRYPASRADSLWTFTCANFPSGKDTIHISLNMYVWDAAKNSDYCTVTLVLQKNTGCAPSRPSIGGDISTGKNDMIKDVQVELQNMNSTETTSVRTNTIGQFQFGNIQEGMNYKLTPLKNDDPLNGVSTLDLVLIQRHILNIENFTTAYQYIAADVNHDNKISANDMVELRKLILGIYGDFPNNKSWRFLDKAFTIQDVTNPWNANEYINVNNVKTSLMDNDFMGIKIGDINVSATVNAKSSTTESRNKPLVLITENKEYQAGQTVRMDITAENFKNISGAQWTMNFDAKALEFAKVNSGVLKMSDENVNTLLSKSGKLAFSWNELASQSFNDDKVLFSIEFRAITDNMIGKTVRLTSDITKAEAYTQDLSETNVILSVRDKKNTDALFALDQNNPNPFSASTTISFTLPQAAKAKVTIMDITGKVVKTISGDYPKGRNEILINAEEINAQGVMFYELESNGLKATRKMIFLSK